MPLRQRKHVRPPGAEDLRKTLADEWRAPREGKGRPVLIKEGGGARPVHLYVIWDRWGDLNQQERSEIIMDAYENAKGQDAALLVTVAMGLTAAEAKRMRIEYK